MQHQPVFRPVDAIAEPVRDVNSAVVIQADDAGLRRLEAFIVIGYHRVMRQSILQFLRALDASRNNRIRKKGTRE
jgi:hypothetical protein